MKVFIPISGGINSAYAAWRWLSQTSYEVVSTFFKEQYLPDDMIQAEEEHAVAVKDWLKDNVRDFTWVSPVSIEPIAEENMPTREIGTKENSKGNISILLNRRNKMISVAKDNDCDATVTGYSLENTATDRLWDIKEHPSKLSYSGKLFYCSTSDIELDVLAIDPFPSKTDTGTFLENLSGRFEQYEALPDGLREIVSKGEAYACGKEDDCWHVSKNKESLKTCWRCGMWDAYENYSGTGAEFDQWAAEKSCAGRWRPDASNDEKVNGDVYFFRNNPIWWLEQLRKGGYNF
tara:strand:- start:564 stop:1436 length:873 start_codon:yes stop_codon:yes gene_type:complete